ncbi:MAG: glycosyltransferase family 2 protein [Thermoguttaceae bacterium]|nr:glycosyltransferase family 2 protein [Thermoguttaceae bacterium]
MWKDLKISIALCTYNGARFLREQLESYSRQTCLPDEVIVCDDGSTDATLSILESWVKSVPFNVQIIQNPQNLGYAQNFGKAVSLCTGDVIFLSDQDDVWEPEKIAKMAEVFAENPKVNLVVSDGFIIDENGQKTEGSMNELTKLWYYDEPGAFCTLRLRPDGCFPQGCASAFRATLRELFLPIPPHWSHDVWLQVTAPLMGIGKVLPLPLFSYRLYSANTSQYGLFQERKQLWDHKRSIYYWNIAEQFWAWEARIEEFRSRVLQMKNEPLKHQYLALLRRNERHFTNRSRIQRNLILFGILVFRELLPDGYAAHLFPVRSLIYDLRRGFCALFKRKGDSK